MTNTLIATPSEPGLTDQAGIVSNVKDLLDFQGPWETAIDGESLALSAIGLAADPINAIAAAGVTWLIEHVSFLKEPVDLLLGDPEEITALEQTWHNIATQLDQAAADYVDEAKQLSFCWTGEAALSYLEAADKYIQQLKGASALSEHTALGVVAAGIIVATVRGILIDALSTAITRWIMEAIAAKLQKLATTLSQFSDKFDDVAKMLEKISENLDSLSPKLKRLSEAAEKLTDPKTRAIGKSLLEGTVKAIDTNDS